MGSFQGEAPSRLDPSPQRDASGNPIKPGAEPAGVAQRSGPPHQHQERGLKGVFDVVWVAQDPAAHPQDQRAVKRYQAGECRLVAQPDEPIQELAIVQPRDWPLVEELLD
jgi:hypothetical protein